MAIPVTCPTCDKKFSAPNEAAGRKARCPSCSTPLMIPGLASGVARPKPADPDDWAPRPAVRQANGFGVASLILGILALLVCWIPLIGLAAVPLGGIGLILGIVGIVVASKDRRKGSALAITGSVLGGVAVVGSVAMMVILSRMAVQGLQAIEAREAELARDAPEVPTPAPGPGGETLAALDRNADGRLSADEVPDRFRDRFGAIDANDDGFADDEEWARSLAKADAPPRDRGPVMATSVLASADDFVIDVYHNGERVPDDRRQMLGDNYGATAEKVAVEVREGDWLVFNVANNRLRWGGACYFGVAGLNGEDSRIAFATEATSGRWSYCDDPGRVPRFIAEADYLADQRATPPAKPWGGGAGEITARAPGWSGSPVWGGDRRNVWIKFNARPAPEDAKAGTGPMPEPSASATPETPAPSEPARTASTAPTLQVKSRFEGAPGLIYSAIFSPDGKTLVTGAASTDDPRRPNFHSREPGTLIAWDVATAKIRRGFGLDGSTLSAAIVGSGKRVAVDDGEIGSHDLVLFDLATGRKTSSLDGPPQSAAMAVVASPDGKKIAAGYDNNSKVVIVWNLATGRPAATLRGLDRPAIRLAFSTDGERLATSAIEGPVTLWDLSNAKAIAKIDPEKPDDHIESIAFAPEGDRFVVAGGTKPRSFDARTGRPVEGPAWPEGEGCMKLIFSPDGSRVATTSVDFREKLRGTIQIRDARTLAIQGTAEESDGIVRAFAFSPDGASLATSSGNVVTLWEVPPPL